MRFTGSPDNGNNPAERSENHIHNGAHHEDLKRAEPIAEPAEDQAERAIAEAENEPANKARCQEMPRQAQKPKDGNRREEAENRDGGDIALHREAFQEWSMIGNNHPCGENQSQTNTHVNTGANRRVAKDVEPTITGQMRMYRHEALGSQDASNRSTRIYGDSCVTSTTTGAPGALSFPARSTAVTVYQ
jgi:hypothetical protein